MRVVQINGTYGVPGIGLSTKQVSDYLSKNGIENIVFYGERKCESDKAFFMGGLLSHKLHALYSRIVGRTGYLSIGATLKMIRQIKKYNPDIVHIRNLHANFVNIPILLKFLAKNDIATVVSLHDCFMMTGGCTHYTTNKCDKWQERCVNCEFLKKNSDYYLVKGTKRSFDDKKKYLNAIPRLGVIGVSDWMTNEARKSPFFKNAKIIDRIYNWVDFDVFKPYGNEECRAVREKLGIGEKKMLLAVAAFWTESKGFSEIIHLARILGEEYRIVLVGKMIINIELPSNIVSVPRTYNQVDLATYYSSADVFIHLSWEETFGKVIAEAMACGTPTITYKSTACTELVADGCGVVITKKGDVEAIKEAVLHILSQGKDLYKEQCLNKSRLLFDMNKNCEKHIEFYKKMI